MLESGGRVVGNRRGASAGLRLLTVVEGGADAPFAVDGDCLRWFTVVSEEAETGGLDGGGVGVGGGSFRSRCGHGSSQHGGGGGLRSLAIVCGGLPLFLRAAGAAGRDEADRSVLLQISF